MAMTRRRRKPIRRFVGPLNVAVRRILLVGFFFPTTAEALDLNAAAADILGRQAEQQQGVHPVLRIDNSPEHHSGLRGRNTVTTTNSTSPRVSFPDGEVQSGSKNRNDVGDVNPDDLENDFHSNRVRTATNLTAQLVLKMVAASGTHHVTVWVGQPPQAQVLIVDTGSHLTAWSCDSRTSTTAAFPPYRPSRSSTHQVIPCGECRMSGSSSGASQHCWQRKMNNQKDNPYNGPNADDGYQIYPCQVVQRYTEGSSWTAYEASELITLAVATNIHNRNSYTEDEVDWTVPFVFGCQTTTTGLFRQQYANGILGLERSHHSIIHSLYHERLIERHAFSLCIGSSGGYMGLGGAVTERHHRRQQSMQFTPIVRDNGMYSVRVTHVSMGNALLVSTETTPTLVQAFSRGKGTLLDSGTTDTFLPHELAEMWAREWEKQTGRLHTVVPRPHRYTYEEFQQLPIVTLQLDNNVTWTIPPLHYMENAIAHPWLETRELILRIYVDEAQGAVLGLNAQRGYDILYDAEGNRIGLAQAHCDDY